MAVALDEVQSNGWNHVPVPLTPRNGEADSSSTTVLWYLIFRGKVTTPLGWVPIQMKAIKARDFWKTSGSAEGREQ